MYHVVQKKTVFRRTKNKELETNNTNSINKTTNYIYYDSIHVEKEKRVIKVRLAVLVPSIS